VLQLKVAHDALRGAPTRDRQPMISIMNRSFTNDAVTLVQQCYGGHIAAMQFAVIVSHCMLQPRSQQTTN